MIYFSSLYCLQTSGSLLTWATVKNTAQNILTHISGQTGTGVGLLDYWLCVFSNLPDNAKLFSEAVVPVHAFTSSVCGIQGLSILADVW